MSFELTKEDRETLQIASTFSTVEEARNYLLQHYDEKGTEFMLMLASELRTWRLESK
jgi:hypothetical protein